MIVTVILIFTRSYEMEVAPSCLFNSIIFAYVLVFCLNLPIDHVHDNVA